MSHNPKAKRRAVRASLAGMKLWSGAITTQRRQAVRTFVGETYAEEGKAGVDSIWSSAVNYRHKLLAVLQRPAPTDGLNRKIRRDIRFGRISYKEALKLLTTAAE